MSSDPRPFSRHQPHRHSRTLAYRPKEALPYDLGPMERNAILMLDTTVYIDAQMAKLPNDVAVRIAEAEILHSAVALGEIAATLGLLDPAHPGTPGVTRVLLETLERTDAMRTVAPSADAWLEASVLAGILARTQHLSKEGRRRLLNDALIFVSAGEAGAVLISRNAKDLDLLLQLKPDVAVRLYGLT